MFKLQYSMFDKALKDKEYYTVHMLFTSMISEFMQNDKGKGICQDTYELMFDKLPAEALDYCKKTPCVFNIINENAKEQLKKKYPTYQSSSITPYMRAKMSLIATSATLHDIKAMVSDQKALDMITQTLDSITNILKNFDNE